MIRFIESPKIDYLKLSVENNGSTMAVGNTKTTVEIIREAVFSIFNMSFDDRKRDGHFEFFEKGGVNLIIFKKQKDLEITFKGFFWFKMTAYLLVKVFLHRLQVLGLPAKSLRIDIRRNFFADRLNEPFSDLRKGFWINRASVESSYSPELYNKGSLSSVGAYFRSEHFVINTYDKSNQMKTFEKRLTRLKKEDRKRPLEVAIKRHRQLYGDKKVFRFEVRITSPDIAKNFLPMLQAKSDEAAFCYEALAMFNNSYPMKNGDLESKKYKKFFERGRNEKEIRVS